MHPLRILASATAIELCFVSAALAALGLAGVAGDGLDIVNCANPLIALLGAAGAVSARFTLSQGRFRLLSIGLGAAAAVYGLAMTAPEMAGLWPRLAAAGASYRVVDANVFHDNGRPRRAARMLVALRADALIMQEADEGLFWGRPVIAAAYPYTADCPWAGVQIWLRTPILAQGCGMTMPANVPPNWGRAFVWVRTQGPDGRPVTLASVHFVRPYPAYRQGLERRALAAAVAALPEKDRLILTGDFNMAPWTFAMRRQDEVLKPLQRWTRALATYPAQMNLTRKEWSAPLLPIDHVYAGRRWQLSGLTRFRIPGSDHFGIQIDARL